MHSAGDMVRAEAFGRLHLVEEREHARLHVGKVEGDFLEPSRPCTWRRASRPVVTSRIVSKSKMTRCGSVSPKGSLGEVVDEEVGVREDQRCVEPIDQQPGTASRPSCAATYRRCRAAAPLLSCSARSATRGRESDAVDPSACFVEAEEYVSTFAVRAEMELHQYLVVADVREQQDGFRVVSRSWACWNQRRASSLRPVRVQRRAAVQRATPASHGG